jgi:hypothetical protein
MSNILIDQKDNTKYLSKTVRFPKDVEDCSGKLRFCDCKMCGFRPKRGFTWRQCKLRVQMFLRDGGVIF